MAKKKARQIVDLPIRIRQGFKVMGWALYEKSSGQILKRRQATPGTADGSLPVGLDPDLAWLVEVEGEQPAFDTATHRLERGESIVVDQTDTRTGTLTTTWTPVELPASEITRKQDDAVAAGIEAKVRAASKKLRNKETVTLDELADVITYMAIRDGLHLDEGV